MVKFFIVCPINFEELCKQEIIHKWPIFLSNELPQLQVIKGGIEIECEVSDGLFLNNILKFPSKILLRLKEQKCRDIPKLFNIIRKFNWKQYLKKDTVKWQISTHQSRLINTKKIQDACIDGISEYFKANALSQKIKLENHPEQVINIRIDNDLLTLSLDTSGDLLHIRGDRSFRGHASIRENFASALIFILFKNNPPVSLLDPMCGTGTFLSEALNFYRPATRDFAYYDWHKAPIFKDFNSSNNIKLYARDIDPQIIEKLTISGVNKAVKDIFKDEDNINVDYVIVNPPYGKRIKIHENTTYFYNSLIQSIALKYRPKKIGILIPETIKMKKEHSDYIISERFFFNNNGIKVNFFILEKK